MACYSVSLGLYKQKVSNWSWAKNQPKIMIKFVFTKKLSERCEFELPTVKDFD